jgi:DNA-binding SARP family transcriptional activator
VDDVPSRGRRQRGPDARLTLLPDCRVTVDGAELTLGRRVQRLLALLAVRGRPLPRRLVAETLWLDSTAARARASLRSTLHQLPRTAVSVVVVTPGALALAPGVRTDLDRARRIAVRIAGGDTTVPAGSALRALRHGLLPDWSEEWLQPEQRYFDELRSRALDALCARLEREPSAVRAAEARLLRLDVARRRPWWAAEVPAPRPGRPVDRPRVDVALPGGARAQPADRVAGGPPRGAG